MHEGEAHPVESCCSTHMNECMPIAQMEPPSELFRVLRISLSGTRAWHSLGVGLWSCEDHLASHHVL